ncbi:MAG: lipid A deacylase LpxR family protein, partial [Steroidobacteraceae bacterium]
LSAASEGDRGRRFGLTLGHQLFTPNDTDTPLPQPNDRPYAAWAYAGFSFIFDRGDTLDTWLLNVGIVGPDAKGKDLQESVHELLGANQSYGWANQLGNELGGQLIFERRWRGLLQTKGGGLGIDVTPHAGASVGNIATYANAGATLRFGSHLRNDYGAPRIRPSLPGSAFFEPREGFGWYVFAGVDGRATAYNIFLDGNTSRESLSVERKPYTVDVQAGAALIINRVRLTYTYVLRSEEFETQTEADKFGSVSISVRF